jgi:hypothetical protein
VPLGAGELILKKIFATRFLRSLDNDRTKDWTTALRFFPARLFAGKDYVCPWGKSLKGKRKIHI